MDNKERLIKFITDNLHKLDEVFLQDFADVIEITTYEKEYEDYI
jgi:hypothetical protein